MRSWERLAVAGGEVGGVDGELDGGEAGGHAAEFGEVGCGHSGGECEDADRGHAFSMGDLCTEPRPQGSG